MMSVSRGLPQWYDSHTVQATEIVGYVLSCATAEVKVILRGTRCWCLRDTLRQISSESQDFARQREKED